MGDFVGHPFRGNQWAQNPGAMTGGELTKAQAAVDAVSSRINQALIDAGRGFEKPSETYTKTDTLSEAFKTVSKRNAELISEVRMRAGPGHYVLPHGVGRSPRADYPGRTTSLSPERVAQLEALSKLTRAIDATPGTSVSRGDYRSRLQTRATTYRDKPGFGVYGKDTKGRSVRVFVESREAVAKVKARIARGEEVTLEDMA